MPTLYTIPHPYNMHQQHRQRRSRRVDSTAVVSQGQEPGSSLSYPIVIPPSPSPCVDASNMWNPPTEPFAWPSLWFDVPSISPSSSFSCESNGSHPTYCDMYDSLPDLIHSDTKTPEASPVSSFRDACTTPAQELNSGPVAICDVPLVAPRPLPFTPPAFLQFDGLPDQDEDLSFPPYTHSRRHLCDSDAKHHQIQNQKHLSHLQNQNPRKRPAPPPNTPTTASTSPGAGANESSISTKKRRRMTVNLTHHSENAAPVPPTAGTIAAAMSRMNFPTGVFPVQQQQAAAPAAFFNNNSQFCFHPQLAHYTRDGMIGLMGVGMGWV